MPCDMINLSLFHCRFTHGGSRQQPTLANVPSRISSDGQGDPMYGRLAAEDKGARV